MDQSIGRADELATLAETLPAQEPDQQRIRAARALYERCAPAPVVAAHLVQTATPVGEDWVVRTLWSAARNALDEGAPERALVAQRRLLAEPHQPPVRARYLAELGAMEVYGDPAAAAEHLRAALPRLASPHLVARAAGRLAGALLDSAAPAGAVAVLSDAIGRLAPRDPDLADELDLQRLSMISWSRGGSPELAGHLDELLDRISRRRPLGRLRPLADALRASLLRADRPHYAAALAAGALDGIVGREDLSEDQAITGFANAAATLLHTGEHRVLIKHCQWQVSYADRRGLRLLAAWARALQAAAHRAAGEHVRAAASAWAVLAGPVGTHPRRLATVLATAVLADCHAEQSQHQQGLALLAGAQLDGDLPGLWVYDQVLLARGRLRLAAGDAAAALADLLECTRRVKAASAGSPVAAHWRPAAAYAAAR